jgi:hypothetical protein
MAKRYKDKVSTRSTLVAFIPEEDFKERHSRRLQSNLLAEQQVREACNVMGLEFRITNEGQHWQFRAAGFRADWFPGTAKLIFDSRWKQGVHVHDHVEALAQINIRLQLRTSRQE